MDRVDFIEMLSYARKEEGMKIKEVAERIDCFAQKISDLERCRYNTLLYSVLQYIDAIDKRMVIFKDRDSYVIDTTQSFCKWLNTIRHVCDRDRNTIASQIGVYAKTITDIANNRCVPKLDNVLKLIELFGFNIGLIDKPQAKSIRVKHSVDECIWFLDKMGKEIRNTEKNKKELLRKIKIIKHLKNLIK